MRTGCPWERPPLLLRKQLFQSNNSGCSWQKTKPGLGHRGRGQREEQSLSGSFQTVPGSGTSCPDTAEDTEARGGGRPWETQDRPATSCLLSLRLLVPPPHVHLPWVTWAQPQKHCPQPSREQVRMCCRVPWEHPHPERPGQKPSLASICPWRRPVGSQPGMRPCLDLLDSKPQV